MKAGDIAIEVVSSIKYLGVVLDEQQKISNHVCYSKRKLVGRTQILGNLRLLVGKNICLNFYKSLVLPVLDYANIQKVPYVGDPAMRQ